jgi:two-component system, chemotaxis family, protein-glutamate methylesterase/glutaminase
LSQDQSGPERLVVIGGSAGSIEVLSGLIGGLPADLPAAVLIAIHISPENRSRLPQILGRSGLLPAQHAVEGEAILAGRVYVAPPDHHLLVGPGHLHLSRGPRENGHRPAIDPLFRSAAHFYRHAVTGVVLSGGADDGAAGVVAIKKNGGTSIAQNPKEAIHPRMPQSAIETGMVDAVLSIPELVKYLADRTVPVVAAVPDLRSEDPAHEDNMKLPPDDPMGDPSEYTCPECHGTLFEVQSEHMKRFRCRIGHAYSEKSLEAEQAGTVETTLWTAVRSLEERAALLYDLADRMRRRGIEGSAVRMEGQAEEAQRGAGQIRQLISQGSLSVLDHNEAGLSQEDQPTG